MGTDNITGIKGKIAIVTGSSKGIGKAVAIAFAKSKDYSGIVINGRKMEEVREVAGHIKRMGCDALAIEADMSKEDDCIKLIERANNSFGRINVLVNNVPFENTTTEEWYKIIGVDLTGPFKCSREAVKHMEKQNPKWGCIINISSVHQRIPKPHYVPYATSKARVEMMTKTIALELAKDNIRVKLVAPGAIQTDMNIELEENNAELKKP